MDKKSLLDLIECLEISEVTEFSLRYKNYNDNSNDERYVNFGEG